VTEELLTQHLESPSRTGRGRVPEPSLATLPAAPDASADTQTRQRPFSLGNLRWSLARETRHVEPAGTLRYSASAVRSMSRCMNEISIEER
jgi:hypothetical protein